MEESFGAQNSTPYPGIPESVVGIVSYVREFMRDIPELNRLVVGLDHSNRLLVWAFVDTVQDLHDNAPVGMHFPLTTLPKSILRKGMVAYALESRSILSARNQLSYVDGQERIDSENTNLYLSLAQMFRSQYERDRDKYIMRVNAARAYGRSPSEYSIVNSLWGLFV